MKTYYVVGTLVASANQDLVCHLDESKAVAHVVDLIKDGFTTNEICFIKGERMEVTAQVSLSVEKLKITATKTN